MLYLLNGYKLLIYSMHKYQNYTVTQFTGASLIGEQREYLENMNLVYFCFTK